MTFKFYFALLLFILLTSCNNASSNEEVQSEQAVSSSNPHGIELINNKKWVVAPNMMKRIQIFATDIQEFDGTTVEEYKALSDRLTENLSILTSNCTMTGQAHDELHKWLLPFLDTSRTFAKESKLSEMEETVAKLKSEIDIFGQYFE